MSDAIGRDFRGESRRLLESYLERIGASTRALGDDRIWWRPHEDANSIANLVLHLEGNLSQWVLEGLGGEPFERRRQGEFSARQGPGRDVLIARLTAVVERCAAVVDLLDAPALERRVRIQGYEVTGLGALYHAVEHAGYHTGQIVMLAKQLLGPDSGIDFYPQHRGE